MPADARPTTAASFQPPVLPRLEPDGELAHRVRHALDRKTKPPGSLGRLEALALQMALVQGRPDPQVAHAEVRVFAGDHGVVAEGVSPYPQAVTAQMVANFLAGGAAISVLARQFEARLAVVDAGVAAPLGAHPMLLSGRIADGTANFAQGPAMGVTQAVAALDAGVAMGRGLAPQSVLVVGEMGIGNTTSSAALMATLTGLDAAECVGRGTGVDEAGLARKTAVVRRALAVNGLDVQCSESSAAASPDAALRALAAVGGFEIAMMAGAMLGAASVRALVVVDGFIATAAAAVALAIDPALKPFLVFAHVSAEAPHARWLARLEAEPLLSLGLRLGEGSGAVLALPLLRAACALLAEMATFDSAGVSDRA